MACVVPLPAGEDGAFLWKMFINIFFMDVVIRCDDSINNLLGCLDHTLEDSGKTRCIVVCLNTLPFQTQPKNDNKHPKKISGYCG